MWIPSHRRMRGGRLIAGEPDPMPKRASKQASKRSSKPKPGTTGEKKGRMFYLPANLDRRARLYAVGHEFTFSGLVAKALEEYLKGRK